MKKGLLISCVIVLFAVADQCKAQKIKKPEDTIGMADVESRLEDLKNITGDMTIKISTCEDVQTIHVYTALIQGIDDTILNHIVPIFDGFMALHPDQYDPLKNINDIADRIITTDNLGKAKKLNDKIIDEYNKLMNSK